MNSYCEEIIPHCNVVTFIQERYLVFGWNSLPPSHSISGAFLLQEAESPRVKKMKEEVMTSVSLSKFFRVLGDVSGGLRVSIIVLYIYHISYYIGTRITIFDGTSALIPLPANWKGSQG